MIALVIALGSGLVVAVPVVLLWLGVRNGDRPGDVRSRVDPLDCRAGRDVVVRVVNPGARPVMVSVRVHPATRLRARYGAPYGARTRLLPAARPAEDALLLAVGSGATQRLRVSDVAGAGRILAVDVIAFQRVGRVRIARHLVRCADGDTVARGGSVRRSWPVRAE